MDSPRGSRGITRSGSFAQVPGTVDSGTITDDAAESHGFGDATGHPRMGDDAGPGSKARWQDVSTRGLRGINPVRSQTYEITFSGRAGSTLTAEFDDCEITIGPGTTTLRADLPDQGALSGLMDRTSGLGLKVIDVSLVALPPGQ
jgi:hypothetical protein